jgi:hypothetical protein
MKTKFLQMLLILILQISVASPAIAQAPRPPVTPPTPFPSRIELIVSKVRDDGEVGTSVGLCEAMRWIASSQIVRGLLYNYSKHQSKSRDANDSSWPCDIDRIGVRGRLWIYGDLYSDTGMKINANSADITVNTKKTDFTCPGISARGNHLFEHRNYPSWYPVTDASC